MLKYLKIAIVAVLCCALVPSVMAKKKRVKAKDLMLTADYTPITAEQKALKDVPFAKGASAVVLLSGEQSRWEDSLKFQRVVMHRRVKILTADGVDDYGDYSLSLRGDWRIKKILARTVLPDGTIVDGQEGENIFREKSEDGDQEIRVAFPQVKPGAILDFILEVAASPWFVTPLQLQEEIPVMEARMILLPPPALAYRTLVTGLDPKLNKPLSFNYGAGKKAHVWRFTNLEPLPDLPFLPPAMDISKKFIVVLDSYKDSYNYVPIAHDWASFGKSEKEYWHRWIKTGHSAADALAKQVAATGTPAQKAEAIRRALRERVRVGNNWTNPVHDSPNEVLKEGSGNSADLAGTTVAMLAAVGVEANLVGFRRRSEGMIIGDIPIPGMLNDLMVQIPDAKGALYFSPAADIAVGQLPWDCSGLLAMVYDGKSDKPVIIPDPKGSDNKIVRKATIDLLPDGGIKGESQHVYHGIAAELMRRKLRDRDGDARKLYMQERLQRYIAGAGVLSVKVENLDNWDADLILDCQWEAAGYGTRAGKRLVVNPNLFSRISAENWTAAERKYPINMQWPFEEIDEVTINLPEGVANVQPLGPANMDAGAVGYYKAKFARNGNQVKITRHMLMNFYTFVPNQWGPLKQWFTGLAVGDDRPVVVTMK